MNGYITKEDILGLTHDDWKVYECDMSGTIEWYNGNGIFIYATPHWETDGEVPFAIFSEESGEYETVKILTLDPNTSESEQLNSYMETLKLVIKVI